MDNLIKKPFKRFLSNSADYAKKQISDYYSIRYTTNSETAVINLKEMKSTTRISTKNNISNNNNQDILLNDSIKTNDSINLIKNCDLNNETNFENNNIQIITTKVIEQPTKNIVQYSNKNNEQNNSNMSEPENIEIINELNKSNQDKKRSLPVVKIKVKFLNKNSDIKTSELVDIKPLDEKINNKSECGNKMENIESIQNIPLNTEEISQKQDAEDNISSLPIVSTCKNVENDCIFDENKSRPLSPIPVVPLVDSEQFCPVEKLIDFHEEQVRRNKKSPKTLPRMGTRALYNRSPERNLDLTDSEIISAMVHDRFVVNLYESRSYKRNMKSKKPSTYGRIYRSLERTVGDFSPNSGKKVDKNQFKNDIIRIKQSSPIKLKDQQVSLKPNRITKQISFSKNDNIISKNIEEELSSNLNNVLLKSNNENNSEEDKFIRHLNLHEEKSSSTEYLYNPSKIVNFHQTFETRTISEIFDEPLALSSTQINIDFDKIEETIRSKEEKIDDSKRYHEEETIYPESTENTINKQMDITPGKTSETTTDTEASSYNMEEFLKKALGEELNKYDSHLDSTTEIESKENIQEKQHPDIKKILHEESMCTSDASDLISKINTFQSNFYRSVTKKLQHMSDTLKHPSAPKYEEEGTESDDLELIFPNNEHVTALVRQAAVQYEAMKQITKALTLCQNTKEFSASSEQVEGERLLLVATYKRQAILDEIRRLDYEVEENTFVTEKGTVLISGVTLPLKESAVEQLNAKRDYNKWYVCIFSCGPRVIATQPILATVDGNVRFSEEIVFTELPSDFTINVEVFCLFQRQTSRNFSHESKYHINKETKKSHCPSPKKFLSREKSTQKIPARYDTGIRTSSFKPCGSLKLRVADLSKQDPWSMRKVPLCSVLNGTILMNLKSIVQIPVKFSGFLTIGSEVGGSVVWNRRWCTLDSNQFRYWNYPCEEDTCAPLSKLDLKYCINANIETVDRALCARPRTLLLETIQSAKSADTVNMSPNIEKKFLAADSLSDLQAWKLHLNIVIRALRTWNVGYFN